MLLVCAFGTWPVTGAWAQTGACGGDCDGDGVVTVDEMIMGVNIALSTMPLDECARIDVNGDGSVSVEEIIVGVNNALGGCEAQANRAPEASDVSLSADPSAPYVEKQLIAHDPDNDTVTYELVAAEEGTGYEFAYVNPDSGTLYLTLAAGFEGTIILPYRVTDGKVFSNIAAATILVQTDLESTNTGANSVEPSEYASFPRGFYDGGKLGAPGADPTLPTSVDLSKDFPRPGKQGRLSSCVGWATAYALKSYQERVEIGWSLEPMEHRFSPAYIYNQINGGRDIGSWFNDALNLVVNQGVATFATMPYNDADFLTQPSAAAVQEASQFKGLSWKTVNGVLEIKEALANHLPVVITVEVLEDLEQLRGPDSVYNTLFGRYKGAHALTIIGYDDQRYGGAFQLINSWGQNWGDGGYFWMPYAMTSQIISAPWGFGPVLREAYVLHDRPNTNDPPPDPVDPQPQGDLPDLQVTNWSANFDGRPGGSGALQYTVTNTGPVTAPAGAYVALVMSRNGSNDLVVYERIPFDMAPGTTAYRDQNNAIAFNFPYDLEPGEYSMVFKADIFNDVTESREDDNVSPSMSLISIVNTQSDMEVVTWYAHWSDQGLGGLTYEVINRGASVAPAGWNITLALSPNDIFGDGDEIFLFSEPAGFDVYPQGTLFRNDASAAGFLLNFDREGHRVPAGTYYIGLWLDMNGALPESNEFNNASLSWGTINIGNGLQASSNPQSFAETSSAATGEAYNGKILPEPASVRQLRLRTTPAPDPLADPLDQGVGPERVAQLDGSPSQWSKVARARQQVIFPVVEMKPMPKSN